MQHGVVVELDFTAIDGSSLLFDTAKTLLAEQGVELTFKLEAMHLAGGKFQGGLAELYSVVGKEGDAAQTARELASRFNAAITERLPGAVSAGLKAFLKELSAKGVKTVLATRGDPAALRSALEGFDPDLVVPFQETSSTYGGGKWDAWRRVCHANGLVDLLTVGVTGSGFGVKAVLVAGMSALAVVHPHVAYQDFGGADAVVDGFNAALAKEALRMLHLV